MWNYYDNNDFIFFLFPVVTEVTYVYSKRRKTQTCETSMVSKANFLQLDFIVWEKKRHFQPKKWVNRDIILRRTSPVPLQTLSSHSSTNSSPALAPFDPACGAGLKLRQSPSGTAPKPAGRTEQLLGSGSRQTVEAMYLDVRTVSYTETSAQQHNAMQRSVILLRSWLI